MRTIAILGEILDFCVFGVIYLLTHWTVIPIALGALIWYSRATAV